ncbi:OmpA/MotB family protein [Desulfospira joergensenii]|uniref:OmpA/MotB family protein n=1 Tax=Desulfospira joergensenii TaxID=53329 RepID=UPI0003B7B520|nr:OmpA family protein [Desulfospira joergensenii]
MKPDPKGSPENKSDPVIDFYDDVLTFPEEKQQNKWSVSWSDLMMTMFILFAVMYIYQIGDKDIRLGPGPAKNRISDQGSGQTLNINTQSRPAEVFDRAKQAVKDIMVDENIAVELVNGEVIKIILAADLLFDPGRDNLKLGARYQLDQIARALSDNEYRINVAGHTDDTPTRSGSFPTNWDLSAQRAVRVARYLTEVCKVDENRIFVTAHSFHEPLRPNDTSTNRALNRRVELILTRQKY